MAWWGGNASPLIRFTRRFRLGVKGLKHACQNDGEYTSPDYPINCGGWNRRYNICNDEACEGQDTLTGYIDGITFNARARYASIPENTQTAEPHSVMWQAPLVSPEGHDGIGCLFLGQFAQEDSCDLLCFYLDPWAKKLICFKRDVTDGSHKGIVWETTDFPHYAGEDELWTQIQDSATSNSVDFPQERLYSNVVAMSGIDDGRFIFYLGGLLYIRDVATGAVLSYGHIWAGNTYFVHEYDEWFAWQTILSLNGVSWAQVDQDFYNNRWVAVGLAGYTYGPYSRSVVPLSDSSVLTLDPYDNLPQHFFSSGDPAAILEANSNYTPRKIFERALAASGMSATGKAAMRNEFNDRQPLPDHPFFVRRAGAEAQIKAACIVDGELYGLTYDIEYPYEDSDVGEAHNGRLSKFSKTTLTEISFINDGVMSRFADRFQYPLSYVRMSILMHHNGRLYVMDDEIRISRCDLDGTDELSFVYSHGTGGIVYDEQFWWNAEATFDDIVTGGIVYDTFDGGDLNTTSNSAICDCEQPIHCVTCSMQRCREGQPCFCRRGFSGECIDDHCECDECTNNCNETCACPGGWVGSCEPDNGDYSKCTCNCTTVKENCWEDGRSCVAIDGSAGYCCGGQCVSAPAVYFYDCRESHRDENGEYPPLPDGTICHCSNGREGTCLGGCCYGCVGPGGPCPPDGKCICYDSSPGVCRDGICYYEDKPIIRCDCPTCPHGGDPGDCTDNPDGTPCGCSDGTPGRCENGGCVDQDGNECCADCDGGGNPPPCKPGASGGTCTCSDGSEGKCEDGKCIDSNGDECCVGCECNNPGGECDPCPDCDPWCDECEAGCNGGLGSAPDGTPCECCDGSTGSCNDGECTGCPCSSDNSGQTCTDENGCTGECSGGCCHAGDPCECFPSQGTINLYAGGSCDGETNCEMTLRCLSCCSNDTCAGCEGASGAACDAPSRCNCTCCDFPRYRDCSCYTAVVPKPRVKCSAGCDSDDEYGLIVEAFGSISMCGDPVLVEDDEFNRTYEFVLCVDAQSDGITNPCGGVILKRSGMCSDDIEELYYLFGTCP